MSKKPPELIIRSSDPAHQTSTESDLEVAIGLQVKQFRKKLNITVAEVAKQAGISAGMFSKIENGLASPSLRTINMIARALNVPVTSLFRRYDEQRDVTFVKAGKGLNIERRGTRAGHQYQLLGHTIGKPYVIEPYVITIANEGDIFPVFEHEGMEIIYMLEGEVGYRHGSDIYYLCPGDSLFFDSSAPHGPDQLITLPAKFLSIIVSANKQ